MSRKKRADAHANINDSKGGDLSCQNGYGTQFCARLCLQLAIMYRRMYMNNPRNFILGLAMFTTLVPVIVSGWPHLHALKMSKDERQAYAEQQKMLAVARFQGRQLPLGIAYSYLKVLLLHCRCRMATAI